MNYRNYVKNQKLLLRLIYPISRYLSGLKFLLILITGHIPSHSIRNLIYRGLGLKLRKSSVIYGKAEIRSPKNITIGANTIIGHNAILDGRGGIEIGDNVNFSTGVWIWTAQHDKNDPFFKILTGRVIIEDYAWVACRVTILPGVRIGKGAVVCSGAVVTKDVAPYTIVAGVPASQIGERSRDLRYELKDFLPFI